MASVTWPTSLPSAPLIQGLRETPQDATVRSKPDYGPALQRRRFSAITRKIEARFSFDGSQLTTFKDFFHNTLSDGADKFDFTDPIEDTTYEFRFTGVYQIRPQKKGRYTVEVKLEREDTATL